MDSRSSRPMSIFPKVQAPSRRGRFAIASTFLLSVLLITSCGSGTPQSAGLVLPISCSSATACLNTAKVDGHRDHVLTPGGKALSAGKSWYYPPQGSLGWGVALSFRDIQLNQNFEESVGTKPVVYPCLAQTAIQVDQNGYQVCLTASQGKLSARFYSSGALYQLHLTGATSSNVSEQKVQLLGIVEQLS